MDKDKTIIADYMIGRTRIRISNACVASPEEQERILKRIGAKKVTREAAHGDKQPITC